MSAIEAKKDHYGWYVVEVGNVSGKSKLKISAMNKFIKGLGEPLFMIENNWRRRKVIVWTHPVNPDMVISVGYPHDFSMPIVCEENRADYCRQFELMEKEGIRYTTYN